jgi:hypothetical protein
MEENEKGETQRSRRKRLRRSVKLNLVGRIMLKWEE